MAMLSAGGERLLILQDDIFHDIWDDRGHCIAETFHLKH